MTDRQLLEAINRKLEAMDGRMDSMSDQIGQLVRHVGEVRQSNMRHEAGMEEMRGDIRALDAKVETKTDFLASKIDHFVELFSSERVRFEEERHLRLHAQSKTDRRLDDIEQRLERLEASS